MSTCRVGFIVHFANDGSHLSAYVLLSLACHACLAIKLMSLWLESEWERESGGWERGEAQYALLMALTVVMLDLEQQRNHFTAINMDVPFNDLKNSMRSVDATASADLALRMPSHFYDDCICLKGLAAERVMPSQMCYHLSSPNGGE